MLSLRKQAQRGSLDEPALMMSEPLAQMVLACSAIEELGQDQAWSDSQREFIERLAVVAEASDALVGSFPQWAEYHIGCLYAEAAIAFQNAYSQSYQSQALSAVREAVKHIARNQNERSPIQLQMIKCRLLRPQDCQPPQGSDPMICAALAVLVQANRDVAEIVIGL